MYHILERKEGNSKSSYRSGFSDDTQTQVVPFQLCWVGSLQQYMCVHYDVLNVSNIPLSHCDIMKLCRVISFLVWCILRGSSLSVWHWTNEISYILITLSEILVLFHHKLYGYVILVCVILSNNTLKQLSG